MHDACLEVIEGFGPERCVWGSDFPCELWTPKVSYAEHLKIFSEVLPLKSADRQQILGETANRLWFTGRLLRNNFLSPLFSTGHSAGGLAQIGGRSLAVFLAYGPRPLGRVSRSELNDSGRPIWFRIVA